MLLLTYNFLSLRDQDVHSEIGHLDHHCIDESSAGDVVDSRGLTLGIHDDGRKDLHRIQLVHDPVQRDPRVADRTEVGYGVSSIRQIHLPVGFPRKPEMREKGVRYPPSMTSQPTNLIDSISCAYKFVHYNQDNG